LVLLINVSHDSSRSDADHPQRTAFLPYINKQYNDEFAKKGMKVGSSVYPRRPVQFTVRTGAVASLQDVVETSEAITIEQEFAIDWDSPTST